MGAVTLEVVVEQYCSTLLPVLMKSPTNGDESVQQQQQEHCCNAAGAKRDDEVVVVHNDARAESAPRPKKIWHL